MYLQDPVGMLQWKSEWMHTQDLALILMLKNRKKISFRDPSGIKKYYLRDNFYIF